MNEIVNQMYNRTLTESSLALASFFSNFDIYTLRTYVGSLNSEGSYQRIEKSLKPIILSLQEAGKKNNQTFTEQDARIFLKTTVEATLAFKEKRYKGFWAKIGLPAINKFAHSFCLALFKTVSPDRYSDLLNAAESVDDIVEVLSHIKKNPAYNQLSVHEKNEIQLAKANALKRLLQDPTKKAEKQTILNSDFDNEELRTILQLTDAERTFIGMNDIRTIKPLPIGLDSYQQPHDIPQQHEAPYREQTREIIKK